MLVPVGHPAGVEGGVPDTPEAEYGAGRKGEHLQLFRTLQEVDHLAGTQMGVIVCAWSLEMSSILRIVQLSNTVVTYSFSW